MPCGLFVPKPQTDWFFIQPTALQSYSQCFSWTVKFNTEASHQSNLGVQVWTHGRFGGLGMFFIRCCKCWNLYEIPGSPTWWPKSANCPGGKSSCSKVWGRGEFVFYYLVDAPLSLFGLTCYYYRYLGNKNNPKKLMPLKVFVATSFDYCEWIGMVTWKPCFKHHHAARPYAVAD